MAEQKRRFAFRFSLRTMLLLTAVAGAWLAYTVYRAKQQEHVVESVIRLGGSVR